MMEGIKEFCDYVDTMKRYRGYIIDMYDNYLYEQWSQDQMDDFEAYLGTYQRAYNKADAIIDQIVWRDDTQKNSFMTRIWSVLQDDLQTFCMTKVRHEAYMVYYQNRKFLVSLLNTAMGWAKNDSKGKFGDLFEYYNDTFAFEPLYIYDEKGNKTKNLAKVVFKASKKIPSDLYTSMRLDGVDNALVMSVGNAYVKARETVFRIFNMMTSRDKTNGYDYYNKDLEAFCKGDLSKQKMQKLYMRLSLSREADNTSDPDIENMDYFQQMDDKAWRSMGINESNTWFDDTIEDYNKRFREKHKDDICKMECVGDDANICRVMLSNGKVYSQTKFYAGDIIEVCPCREIDKSSLYSKDMRDIVLEVEKNSTFVIPFGYCQYYDVSGYGKEPNCAYHWDKDKMAIVITAKMRIPRHCPLVLDIVSAR